MKVTMQVTPKIKVEFESTAQTDMFKQLSELQEVFGEERCGKCKANNLKFVVRTVKENNYYELRCQKCNAVFSFGIHRSTGNTLFPKRRDNDDGEVTGEPNGWLPDNGWLKWDPEQKRRV
jgi:hypothetical protein